MDMLVADSPGLWETQAVLEETDCRAETRTPEQRIDVGVTGGFERKSKYFLNFGPNFPLGELNDIYDPGFSLNIGLDRALSPDVSVVGLVGFHQFYSPIQNLHFVQGSLNLKYTYFRWSDKFAYIQGGAGFYIPSQGNTALGANIGTGLTWVITPRLGLDLHIAYHFVKYSFGGLNTASFIPIQMGIIWTY
jgi:hypothetical protein